MFYFRELCPISFFVVCRFGCSLQSCRMLIVVMIVRIKFSVVNVSAISIGFLLVSLVTNRVSLEEECLQGIEVLNCFIELGG